ncbi:MAG: 2-oxo acid dehydrogenase subunit E2 [Saccharopolyspora sp.]|uniref:dihydrolipoamide acetyltransferase family protein n=1 Tax=Saccharopolyspora sp. TaxID=33915 RepID=UPI0025EB9869|nr:dihydrolipoamide acetyltransferase family protein [Saccharopolyspora sp.]MBQ6643625.1 2-oxo acid dehydrogenase subunit E2 [Saccharopolyspora sp.]
MNSTAQEFHLPDVGEGLTEAEIVTWHVAEGDPVAVNQAVVDIETAKSVVALPAPHGGEVLEVLAAEGETVQVGTPILRIGSPAGPEQPAGDASSSKADAAESAEDEPKLLVGYGNTGPNSRRSRRQRRDSQPQQQESATARHRPLAKPPVRKLAKELGVDLGEIRPSGQHGIVARQDVLAHAEKNEAPIETGRTETRGTGAGRTETRVPIKGVRKRTAEAVVASAFTAPHVTEFSTIDVTRTMQLREQIQQRREFRDVKLTPLAFAARAYLAAIARTPIANARWDEDAQEIMLREQVDLGIAAATPRGLVVPNVEAAQRLSLRELASSINELAETARAGATTPGQLAGGTTTITNIGVFGVDSGTPILNPGQTAILAVGAVRRMPWVVHDEQGERIEPRSVLQLALSFDHRVMDGQQGSELLADTAAVLADPGMALL